MIDNGDGTITDPSTDLMWQKVASPDAKTWEEALSYCKNLNLGGYSDWRLPDITELISLVQRDRENPVIDIQLFPNTESDFHWSSTADKNETNYAWGVTFGYGGEYLRNKNHKFFLRSVRGESEYHSDESITTSIIVGEDMKPAERQKKMEKKGWRIHRKWFWQERIVMVRIELDQEPEYATIFPDGKLRRGDHSPVVTCIRGDSGYEYPAYN